MKLACETGPIVCIWQVCSSRIDQLAAHGLAAPVMQASVKHEKCVNVSTLVHVYKN